MPTAYLMVGPPGAGKTTFVSWSLVAGGDLSPSYVLNPDGLLYEGMEYRWSKSRVARAWRRIREDYHQLLRTRRNLALDATNVQRDDRREYVEAASHAGYRVIAVWFAVPLDVLVERDAQREDAGKRVGEERIRQFLAAAEAPTAEEGFDEVWTVGPDGQLTGGRASAS